MFTLSIKSHLMFSYCLQAVEDEAVEKYYKNLEKKEMLEDKMASIMEMPTTAYVCLKVNNFYKFPCSGNFVASAFLTMVWEQIVGIITGLIIFLSFYPTIEDTV